MDLVVGSGPAGIACAKALVARGRRVLIIDGGVTLEPEREAARAALAAKPSDHWSTGQMAALRAPPARHGAPPLKRVHGSDFPYRGAAGADYAFEDGLGVRPSNAVGGFSHVWGSVMLPYGERELSGWPIRAAELEPGYRAVLGFMPLAGEVDALAHRFPLHADRPGALPRSRQIAALLTDLNRSATALDQAGVAFGASRLAIEAEGCVICGACLHGCPKGLIYATGPTLDALIRSGAVEHRPGLIARSLSEDGAAVAVHAVDATGARHTLTADRVFLAAGAIGTTAILLRSLHHYDRPVEILDSQYFLMPLLRLRAERGVTAERLHTLCQAFLEVDDPAISPHTVHLQLYGYNDLLRAVVAARLGPLRRLIPEDALLGRLLLIQGYLHSDHSGRITATLRRDDDILHLAARPSSEARRRIGALARKLTGLAPHLRALPVGPLAEVTEPGRGYHHGGAFPMRRDGGAGGVDPLGRPHGFNRVHAVDATVFPTIPATTITLTVMANAWRIAAEVAAMEQAA